MDKATAEKWVTISALMVGGIYAYRRLTEATSTPVTVKKLVGIGNPVPLGAFATAWGFTFLVVAMMAEAAPGLGGAFAILIAAGDFLTNSSSVFQDVTNLEKPSQGLQQIGQSLGAAASTGTIQLNTTPTGSVGSGLSLIGNPGLTAGNPFTPGPDLSGFQRGQAAYQAFLRGQAQETAALYGKGPAPTVGSGLFAITYGAGLY